jgi:hypothetical protein
MKVKFLRDVATKEATPQTFQKDEVVDFFELYSADPELKDLHGDELAARARVKAQASARHWINRGAAVEVKEEGKEGRPARQAGRTPPPEKKADAESALRGRQQAQHREETPEPGTFTVAGHQAQTAPEGESKDQPQHGKRK